MVTVDFGLKMVINIFKSSASKIIIGHVRFPLDRYLEVRSKPKVAYTSKDCETACEVPSVDNQILRGSAFVA